MASNTTLNSGAGGDVIATKERTHDGDATKVQVVTLAGVSGTEGSYTFADVAAGAGAESAALRVTLATESLAALETVELGATTLAALETISVAALPAGTNAIGTVTAVGAAAEDAAVSGNPVLVGGRYDSSARTLESGDAGAFAVNASGQLLVEIAAGAGSGGTSAADGATFTRNTTSITPVGAVVETSAPTLTNGDVAGLSQDTSGRLRVRVEAGGVAGVVDDAAFTPGTTETVAVGFFADEASTDSVDEGDMGAARMTQDRKQIVTPRPHASGGLSIFRSLDLDETEEDIKTSAGQLYGYYFANTNASARYLKFYNATAANVTVGTTTPVLTFYLPPTTAGHIEFSHGIAFSTAISAAATTGVADNDTGAPSANDVILNAFYA